MEKLTLIILAIVWISALIIAIISLANLYPNYVFSENRLIVHIVL